MPLDPQTLGARIRHARENCGFSQQKAADELGLPRPAITLMESGSRAVTTLELSRLADLYGRQIADFFVEGASNEASSISSPWTVDGLLITLPRALKVPGADPASLAEIDRYLDLCREGMALEKMLERTALREGLPTYRPRPPKNTAEAVVQGSQIAEEERRRLGLGSLPLNDLPGLLSAQGVWACSARLPDAVSGLFLSHPDLGMVVLVNRDHVSARRRFSYAHEYAHALLDRERAATISTSDNSAELVEKRANAFAAALLLPPSGVEEALRARGKGQPSRYNQPVFNVATGGRIDASLRPARGSQTVSYQDVSALAHQFGVSYPAATYRLRSLGLISQPECEALLAQASTGKEFLEMLQLWDDLEGRDVKKTADRELRTQIVGLAIEAYRREEISRGRLLELAVKLELSGPQVAALAEAAKGVKS